MAIDLAQFVERYADAIRIYLPDKLPERCIKWLGAYAGPQPVIRDGRQTVAVARAIYHMFNGAFPTSMVVLRTCNHLWCVNPKHLKLEKRSTVVKRIIDRKNQHS